jgi:hypothetical protein
MNVASRAIEIQNLVYGELRDRSVHSVLKALADCLQAFTLSPYAIFQQKLIPLLAVGTSLLIIDLTFEIDPYHDHISLTVL